MVHSDKSLGFVWAKIYILFILINVLAAIMSLVLNAIDPLEYSSASDPLDRAYFIAISVVGSFSGFGLLMRTRIGLYATFTIFGFIALMGLVVIFNMDTVGFVQGILSFGLAWSGFRYFWRRRNWYIRAHGEIS